MVRSTIVSLRTVMYCFVLLAVVVVAVSVALHLVGY